MREILFRAKRDPRYEYGTDWVYGVPYIDYENDCIMATCNSKLVVIADTVGQFTGVCDSAGEKIFEGDIVKAGPFSSYIVSFSEDRRGYYPFACGDGCGCCEYDTFSPSFCKVIGNIFDNPKLAKKATSE